MLFRSMRTRTTRCALFVLFLFTATFLHAAQNASIHGTISDPLGAVVANADVELLGEQGKIASVRSDANGNYSFSAPAGFRYTVRATAKTFEPTTSDSFFATAGSGATVNVVLATKTLTQQVTVTATGRPTPAAQTGSSITVLTQKDYSYQSEVQNPLRMVPGVQVTQTGQMGGTTGVSIRGGNTDDNKVLIDGVPANDIGGAVEFGNIDSVGIDRIEVLREPNSALYGSDALAGVINLTTARGTTPLPLFTYAADGGNFDTYRQQATLGGVYRSFDYYSAYARMNTQNSIPNSGFHNGTYAGNFGWDPNAKNDFRFTTRHLNEEAGQANALLLYGIPDSTNEQENDTYYSAAWDNHATGRWHNQIRYGGLRLHYFYNDFAATGIYDPDLDVYLGAPVTISGANGYTVSGQAIFQYGTSYGDTYPNSYVAPSKRDFVYAQTDYQVNPHLVALGAFKYEAERGSTQDSGLPAVSISRGNYSYTIQLAGDFWNRLYYTVGSGLEDNGLFGFAATPRASLAYYLVRPSGDHLLSGTKLHFSFGKGIKEPSIYNQSISLYDTLAALPDGQQLIAEYGVQPIGPEESRTYDGGVEQQLWDGRARINLSYFHNEFTNGVEFVPQSALIALGIAGGSDPAAQYGAAVNSMAYRTQGVETEIEYRLNSFLFARGGYTYTDAVVQRSFSSESAPSYNPLFPGIPIGDYSPLVGARPFRVAPHTGYFALNLAQKRWNAALTGTLVGRRDDSDFLTDSNFGNTLLLPNRNLDGAYQRLDLNGDYAMTHHIALYANLQNLLSEHYSEAFGYPALPFTLRAGMKFSFGGESWKMK